MSWTSFNMPATIQRGTNVLGYDYDTEHNRIKQASTDTVTLFFRDPASGLTVEKVNGAGGSLTWNNYIYVGGAIVAVFYERPLGTSQWRYFHQDNLGSTELITDDTGAVVERQSYDAWGKRRYPSGADDPTEAITSSTDRGFTGHAHLAEVGLIHMNGRIYDPVIARFMSADPNVQEPLHTQSLNRYTYVINNPLAYTDPSGYFFFHISRKLAGYLLWGPIGGNPAVQRFVAKHELAQIVLTSIAAFSGNVWVAAGIAAATSGYVTWAQGGSIVDVLRSAAIAAGTTFAFNRIGTWTNFHGAGPERLFTTDGFFNVAGHAAVGCGSSLASGGTCEAGAFSGAAGAFAGPLVKNLDFYGGLVSTAAIGGTASVVSGGSFWNGAKTAAYGYLFNQEGGEEDESGRRGGLVDPDPQAELRITLWETAVADLRAIEPYRSGTYVVPPGWIPTGSDVADVQTAVTAARQRIGIVDGIPSPYTLGSFKSTTTWNNQMTSRGWTMNEVETTLRTGRIFPATNYVYPPNQALRFESLTTGKSVVVDTARKEILQLGGRGFKY